MIGVQSGTRIGLFARRTVAFLEIRVFRDRCVALKRKDLWKVSR